MSGHFMTIDFSDRLSSMSLTTRCDEPPEALCRAQWPCECEHYADHGIDERGPWHELDDGWPGSRPTRHYGEPGGECQYLLFIDNSDYADELGDGQITFPIDLAWSGDDYTWSPSEPSQP